MSIRTAFKRWRQKRAKARQLKACQRDGHTLVRNGEMTPGRMVKGKPVAHGKPDFWLFACKCGYGEVNDVGTKDGYRRSWEDAEKLKNSSKL